MDKLQWGSTKRLRCMKIKDSPVMMNGKSDGVGGGVVKKKITSRIDRRVVVSADEGEADPTLKSLPHRLNRDLAMSRSNANENRKPSVSSSPEKEDRYYTTRGSGALDENSKLFMDPREDNSRKFVWPKLVITLSSKEKEEDFMAMKGCKPPQRPKKRAKLIQKSLLLVSPGAWLSDLCQERYEVREKKTSKKKPRGLKAMGSMESDSE